LRIGLTVCTKQVLRIGLAVYAKQVLRIGLTVCIKQVSGMGLPSGVTPSETPLCDDGGASRS
jgi:hypothetical protein